MLTLFGTGPLAFFRKRTSALLDVPVNDQPDSRRTSRPVSNWADSRPQQDTGEAVGSPWPSPVCGRRHAFFSVPRTRIAAPRHVATIRLDRCGTASRRQSFRRRVLRYDRKNAQISDGLFSCQDSPIRLDAGDIGDGLAHFLQMNLGAVRARSLQGNRIKTHFREPWRDLLEQRSRDVLCGRCRRARRPPAKHLLQEHRCHNIPFGANFEDQKTRHQSESDR